MTSIIAAQTEKSATRNFYAVLTNAQGKETSYAFSKVEDRKSWMERRGDNAQVATALDIYKRMQKSSSEYIIANRNNRLTKIKAGDSIDLDKGQRIVLK